MLTNTAPFFERDLPESVTFQASDTEFVFELPSVLDSTDNFCEVEIESETLGTFRYSSCEEETE